MYRDTIGLVGGFGGYATLDFYRRILASFAGEKESDYPHIRMDNDFTMPSRTRALLYGERYDEVVRGIYRSITGLLKWGGDTHIILVCGTAHAFLDDVYKMNPHLREHVVDIIDALGEELQRDGVSDCAVLAAEGALHCGLYRNRLYGYEIEAFQPDESAFEELRYFIESVKRNLLNDDVAGKFVDFINRCGKKQIVLGCTEFPPLVDFAEKSPYGDGLHGIRYYDPLEISLKKLKQIMR